MPDITTAFVKQFHSSIEHLVQQKGSRLRNAVRVETGIVGEEAFFDQLGATAAVKRTTRHADTPLIQSDHQRRRVSLIDFEWADLIDKQDKLKTLIDPASNFAESAASALGRSMDEELITAANGTAQTGKTGSTATTLPAAQKIAAGGTGLTIAKLVQAKKILDAAEAEETDRVIVVSAEQLEDLLNNTTVTSADFNTVKALVMGQIDTFVGFKFIRSQRLNVDGASARLVLVWQKLGMLLAVTQDIATIINQRADKGNAWQVYLNMGIGATRMQETKVVEIACVE